MRKKTIPRAIMIIILAAGILYISTSYLTQVMYPQLSFANVDSCLHPKFGRLLARI
jgi:putrescine importer